MTYVIRYRIQFGTAPSKAHPITPTNNTNINIGFLKSLLSAMDPKTGPMIATRIVAILVAYDQNARYSELLIPAFAAKVLNQIGMIVETIIVKAELPIS